VDFDTARLLKHADAIKTDKTDGNGKYVISITGVAFIAIMLYGKGLAVGEERTHYDYSKVPDIDYMISDIA